MGMYTELVFKATLKNPPEEIVNMLRGTCTAITDTDTKTIQQYGSDRLFVFLRTEIKNYDQEIEKFLEWVKLYIDPIYDCIGWYWYEEDSEPTLLYM